jgi:hypothetical protein
MLAQLLGRQGLGARAIPNAAVSTRAALAALDASGALLICLTYAGAPGTSSQLRYIVRRLRAQAPAAIILVGFWPTDLEGELRMRNAVGADLYTTALGETVAACVARAHVAACVARANDAAPISDA